MADKAEDDCVDDYQKGSDSDDAGYKTIILKTFKVGIDKITSISSGEHASIGHFVIICNSYANEVLSCKQDGQIISKYLPLRYDNRIENESKWITHIVDIAESLDGNFLVSVLSEHPVHSTIVTASIQAFGNENCIFVHKLLDDSKYQYDDDCFFESGENGSEPAAASYKALLPEGLCVLQNDDVAFCFVEKHSYELNANSRRLVTIFRKAYDGAMRNEMAVIEYRKKSMRDGDNRERFFTYPKRIAESDIEDLWVVDRKGPSTGDVKIFDNQGHFKYVYTGSDSGTRRFDPTDISSNTKDVMVITDCSNHRVHLVRNDGIFLHYLMTEQENLHFPRSVHVNNFEHAWIGCNDGTVHILKYFPEFE